MLVHGCVIGLYSVTLCIDAEDVVTNHQIIICILNSLVQGNMSYMQSAYHMVSDFKGIKLHAMMLMASFIR